MANSDTAIHVENLSKCFNVYRHPKDLVLEFLFRSQRHEEFWALKDVNLAIKRGEVIGLIGRNGSGKSTLLRILTGVLDHTRGAVEVNGKVSAILELGTGFHPQYTGRDNIIRGGMVLGMPRRVIESKVDSIIEFSGLRECIDRPFKTYSSGMQSRLTFATATAIDPDIFIVDEALATGDSAFVHKCLKRIRDICQSGCTSILVSHSTAILGSICTRIIWLDRGQVHRQGKPLDVIREYDLNLHQEWSQGAGRVAQVELAANRPIVEVPAGQEIPQPDALAGEARRSIVFRKGPIRITQVDLIDEHGEATTRFKTFGSLTMRVHYECDGPLPEESLGMAVSICTPGDMTIVMQFNTHCYQSDADIAHYQSAPFRSRAGHSGVFEARIDPLQVREGEYLLSLGLLPNLHDIWHFYEYHHHAYTFHVKSQGWLFGGPFKPIVEWSHRTAGLQAQAA